jgi:hypothetical protein
LKTLEQATRKNDPTALALTETTNMLVIHPSYRNGEDTSQVDLAIVHLKKPILKGYSPVEMLLSKGYMEKGAKVIMAGYGRTNQRKSDRLRHRHLKSRDDFSERL